MKIKIRISGPRVHNVGYRPFLITLADEFGIRKFEVFNSILAGNQVVIAKTEADEDQFQAFMDAIRSRKPKKAEVSDISYEPFEGSVHSIMRTLILNITAQLAKFDQILDRQELGYRRAQDLEKHGKGSNETQAIWR